MTSTNRTSPLVPGSIARIASDWLEAERDVAAGIRNPTQAEESARELSGLYDEAIRSASHQELRLAWEAAVRHQGEQEIGSEAWLDARRLSELLRTEYEAASPDPIEASPE
jgi:hypothetical protein